MLMSIFILLNALGNLLNFFKGYPRAAFVQNNLQNV